MNEHRKIVMLLSNSFRPDPRVLKEAESLAEVGYDITIICWDRLAEFSEQELLQPGIRIIRVQNIRSNYGIGIKQISKLVKFWTAAYKLLDKVIPEVIHCHDFDTLPVGLLWGKLKKVPVVYDAHEHYAELVRPRLRGWIGTSVFKIISHSENTGAKYSNAVITVDDILGDSFKKFNKNVHIIGHYPNKKFSDTHNPVFTRQVITLLYVGRISIDRGALIYIDIIRHLKALNIPAILVFAGIITPAADSQVIIQHMGGIEDSIILKGWIPYQNIRELYLSSDIGLSILMPIPRYILAVPVKLFEYMAHGLPVIASNFPNITAIVNDANCGNVVDPTIDPKEIARIIENWWHDPALAQFLGENGRLSVHSKYNWESSVNKLSDLYRQLLE